MALENGWVGYLQRSYTQIKAALISRLVTKVPEVTDHSESNMLILLISMFSGLIEQLNYYIDNIARESFITTARRYSSAIKLVKLIDYRIKASIPSTVDITITLKNGANPFPLTSNYSIPMGTVFETSNGTRFVSTKPIQMYTGDYIAVVPAKQQTEVTGDNIGTTNGLANQQISLPANYADTTLLLTVGVDLDWVLVDTFGRSKPTDKHYTVEIKEDKIPYLTFGDGINGLIPPSSQTILADYFITNGLSGNVEANTITSLVSTLLISGNPTIEINNEFSSAGGLNVETLSSIARRAPLSLRTLDRAVTRQDYKDIAVLAPGVNKADLFFDCGKTIDIYITPEGGGIAQAALLSTTKDYIDQRKMVTTFVQVLPAGESILKISIEATARFRANAISTLNDIQVALLDLYSFDNSDVNKKIRKSDIIAVVDNLAKVDFLKLNSLKLLPYPRPYNHTTQLVWLIDVLVASTQKTNWRLHYDGINFNVFKNNNFIGSTPIGSQFTDINSIIQFTIIPSSYSGGQYWDFVTYPVNEDIELDDYTMPITDINYLDITVNEQLVTNN